MYVNIIYSNRNSVVEKYNDEMKKAIRNINSRIDEAE